MQNILSAQKNITQAKRVMELLILAMEGIANKLSGSDDMQQIQTDLQKFYFIDSRLSYKNISIYKQSENIIGAMCCYAGDKAKSLDAPIIAHLRAKNIHVHALDSECFSDEFYIDSLAVDANFRNCGIATKMFKHAEILAKQNGYKKLSLVIDKDKPKTREFYQSLGFSYNCDTMIAGHVYQHMNKRI